MSNAAQIPTDFVTPPCCSRPSIATMDHLKGWPPDTRPVVNRVCIQCWRHWYGEPGAVQAYTRSEWDAMMGEALA